MYINTSTNKYPYTDADLRQDNPQVSFPSEITEETRNSFGVHLVETAPKPLFNASTHKLIEGNPSGSSSAWVQTWDVVELSEEEVSKKIQNLTEKIVQATQDRLDSFARTRNYDGILSACTYATSNVPKFSREGQAAVNLRDATWAALYQILEEVQAGQREAPTGFSDIEHLLPPLEWSV